MQGNKIILLIVIQMLGINTDSLYPLSNPVSTKDGVKYSIGVIRDFKSKCGWGIDLKLGHLIWKSDTKSVHLEWDTAQPMVFRLKSNDRAEERHVSELFTYAGKHYVLDTKGRVMKMEGKQLLPWKALKNADGSLSNNITADWATVKNGKLYIGGMDLEEATVKPPSSFQWTRILRDKGEEEKFSWKKKYSALAYAVGHESHGYMKFGAVVWNEKSKRWFLMPSECSSNDYDPKAKSDVGCNVLLTANENFSDIEVFEVGNSEPTQEFTSFKIVPGIEETIVVALQSTRNAKKQESYVTVFSPDGLILLPKTKIAHKKYKGIEFL